MSFQKVPNGSTTAAETAMLNIGGTVYKLLTDKEKKALDAIAKAASWEDMPDEFKTLVSTLESVRRSEICSIISQAAAEEISKLGKLDSTVIKYRFTEAGFDVDVTGPQAPQPQASGPRYSWSEFVPYFVDIASIVGATTLNDKFRKGDTVGDYTLAGLKGGLAVGSPFVALSAVQRGYNTQWNPRQIANIGLQTTVVSVLWSAIAGAIHGAIKTKQKSKAKGNAKGKRRSHKRK